MQNVIKLEKEQFRMLLAAIILSADDTDVQTALECADKILATEKKDNGKKKN